MRADEKFLARWSRLKRESESQKARKTGLTENAALSGDAEEGVAGAETRAAPTFDPASLPPIESITADTDISMFLASGVPAKLTEAALRRAWVSDPVIRDFIGIAENQWDFTNPTTIPGFGPLHETGDKLSLIAQTVPTLDRSLDEFSARLSATDASAEKTRSVTDGARCGEIGDTVGEKRAASATRGVDSGTSNAAPESGRVETAVQNNLFPDSATPRRRHAHGGALPR
jgi:Protein of unknown function (DUF3306)